MRTIDHSQNVVEINNVSFSYGGNEILKNINLNIHRGDYLGLVGSNGSGKTTLLKIILGLLAPTAGSVKLFGQNARGFKDRSRVGYVPQKATHFDSNFPATAREIVLMGRYALRGLGRRVTPEDRRRAEYALEQVEMSALHNQLIGELSSGQQQRVFIARALAVEPEIIFLDEPTVGIDKTTKDEFYALLRKLNEKFNLTVVLITHDVENIRYGSMHVACIDRTLFFHNSLEEYLEETRIVAHHHG